MARSSYINNLGKNGVILGSVFRQRFICCALTVLHSTYNMVGWSIASIYNLGGIFTSAFCASVNMLPWDI